MMNFVWISFINLILRNQNVKRKLSCHCGGVEGQVECRKMDLKKLCGAIALYVKERVTLLELQDQMILKLQRRKTSKTLSISF